MFSLQEIGNGENFGQGFCDKNLHPTVLALD